MTDSIVINDFILMKEGGEEVGENEVEEIEKEVLDASQPTQRKRTLNYMEV